MNVTTSVGWSRPPVGIVRVERALAEHLQALLGPDRLKLCVWRDDRFVEWVDVASEPTSARIGQALDVILPRTASFDLARPFLMRAMRKYAESETSANAAPGVRMYIPATSPERPHPVRGDFVISAGLDWDNRYTARFHAMSRKQGLRIITCCYDLIPVLFPQYCVGEVAQKFTEYFLQLCWGSEAVLCISRQTENDFKRLCADLGAPERRTVVIPLGDSVPGAGGEIGDEVRSLSQQPFILFVSTLERRKNHEVLYRAYHLLARRGHFKALPRLVFVGMPGWGIGDLLKDIELDPLTQGLIVQLHHVSDSELNHLYQHAAFCVYPSLYEGWGLPVGEALAMGKAVLASREGSLPEVGGDLVRYVDPWDVFGWAEAILDWAAHPEQVRQAERSVRQRYKPRLWSQTAAAVRQLIEDLPIREQPLTIHLDPGYDMSTHAGVHVGPSIMANGEEGALLFGPHWSVNAGSYELHVQGSASGNTVQSADFELASAGGATVHHAARVKVQPGLPSASIATMRFELEHDVTDLELRCLVRAGSTLRIDHVRWVSAASGAGHRLGADSQAGVV